MAEPIEELDVNELEQLLMEAYADNTDEENNSVVPSGTAPVETPKTKPKLTTEGSSFLLGDTENTASGSSNHASPEADASVAAMIRDADVDSSDDEETRNFFERKYNQYGRQINDLLKSKEEEKTDQALSKWVDNKLRQINRATAQPPAAVARSPEQEEAKKKTVAAKPTMSPSPGGNAKKDLPANKIPAVFEATVHTDPIFGMRIVHPLVSSQMLQEHMKDKKAVPFVRLRNFVETADLEQDWVIGGVLVSKSPTKTTSKGKQFAIWKLSDLHGDIKMVTLFLFGSAYKDLWKTTDGTVVAVLNPNVLNGNNEKNSEATLSIDRATKVMILGQSRDLGKCRSRKKNGERCTAIVNLGKCEYCVYHIKQEYGKACNRGGILTSTGGQGLNGLRNKVLGKNEVFYAGQSFSAIKAVKHPKQMEKDRNRMLTLSDYYRSPFEGSETGTAASSPSSVPSYRRTGTGPSGSTVTPKGPAARVEVNVDQRKKDMERLQSLGVSLDSFKTGQQSVSSPRTPQTTQQPASLGPVSQTPASSTSSPLNPLANRKFSLESVPRLSRTSFDIEFTKQMPSLKALQSRARATAILKDKPAEKSNPNFIKYRGTEQGKKRVLEEVAKNAPLSEENAAKRQKVDKAVEDEAERARKEHMKRIIEATSSHQDLVVARENEQQEEYFKTLERKEAMEEKMLNTFKVACKAVSCRQCKYIAFSAADRCKTEGHQLRVHDAEKRFFRCADCGGRTVSLFRIPKVSCKACQGSRWERCAMMREKRGVQIGDVLSIRGDEEKYLGSLAGASASLNLLMPEES
ncbi:AGAP008723-PA-like protein [Anopheles sinensis]|uniref:Protein MCM10 homolog n=1 Tax=Anopheles sinensis TaxID=74873 RepID=A0A084VMI5_ANOSI|nr:AGAP008723-PA-like protein [Anopheles sinensis]